MVSLLNSSWSFYTVTLYSTQTFVVLMVHYLGNSRLVICLHIWVFWYPIWWFQLLVCHCQALTNGTKLFPYEIQPKSQILGPHDHDDKLNYNSLPKILFGALKKSFHCMLWINQVVLEMQLKLNEIVPFFLVVWWI